MPEFQWTTNGNGSTSPEFDFAKMAEIVREFKAKHDENDRKVFHFVGTMEDLKRSLTDAGVAIDCAGQLANTTDQAAQFLPVGIPNFHCGMEIRQCPEGFLIGTTKAIRNYEEQQNRLVSTFEIIADSPYRLSPRFDARWLPT